MKGRIKAGEGGLIGNAGEYYVVAELLKRGIVAALAPRNAPAFDILAIKDSRKTGGRFFVCQSPITLSKANFYKDDVYAREAIRIRKVKYITS